ncbi:MAG: NAD(P)/FAD-dependent oxidoreductase [Gammaproteobacteria bacterium]|jgi:L-2-hydroxyglutarate oxidase LhgO
MSEAVDCVVIGAGVVGLAVGRALAGAGREVIVLERNADIGEETSSRNSEVIHAGLYYPTGSLKAKLCVTGKALLYAYCDRRQIAYQRCGKLIVATDAARLASLDAISEQAARNGVTDLERIDQAELKRREPAVAGAGALWSPSTGIVDAHSLMLALQGELEAAAGVVATQTEVRGLRVTDSGIHMDIRSGDDESELVARTVVNSGGLGAVDLAKRCQGVETGAIPRQYLAKGNYFIFSGKSPFHALVYPLPQDGGLGIHATHDLAGKLRFGPDVEWIEAIDYTVDPDRRARFAESIRQYWPALEDEELVPGYAGIRPKLAGPGEHAADFRIELAAADSSRQLVHLLGIESPGLTAALAIAEEVAERVEAAGT